MPWAIKIATVLATSTSITANTEANDKGALQHIPSIWYLVQFQVQALIDSGSEVNAMTPAYVAELGLTT